MRLVVLALVLALTTSVASADKVAVFDSDRLYEAGGIARWLATRAKLDADKGKFNLAESPDGKTRKPYDCDKAIYGADFCQAMKKADDESRRREVWEQHERSVLDPIEAEIDAAIPIFAKARGIDILVAKRDVVYVSPSADITSAFIKDFNAKPTPKPAPPKPAPKRP